LPPLMPLILPPRLMPRFRDALIRVAAFRVSLPHTPLISLLLTLHFF